MRFFCTHDHHREDRLFALLTEIKELIVSNEAQVEGQLTDIDGALSTLVTDFNNEIESLKTQIANGTPVTQEQLDGVSSHLGNILSAIKGADPGPTQSAPVPSV